MLTGVAWMAVGGHFTVEVSEEDGGAGLGDAAGGGGGDGGRRQPPGDGGGGARCRAREREGRREIHGPGLGRHVNHADTWVPNAVLDRVWVPNCRHRRGLASTWGMERASNQPKYTRPSNEALVGHMHV